MSTLVPHLAEADVFFLPFFMQKEGGQCTGARSIPGADMN